MLLVKFGNAAVFNGSSSQIEVSTTSTTPVDFSSKNYSLSLWVNTTSTTTGILLSKYGDTDAARAFTLQLRADGTIQMYERGTGTFEATDTTTTINDGNWHHIVVVRSSTSTIIYIDNSPTTNNNTFTSNNGGTEPFRIGRDNIGSPDYFNGSIDQVRIFDSALPQAAVTALYNETTTTATSASVDYQVANPNSVAYYKMSDATDQLGNYNGTATNVNFNTEGKFGFAGEFNVNNRIINLPSSFASVVSSNSTITVSAWVKELVRHDSNGGVIIEFSDGRAIVAPGTQSAPYRFGAQYGNGNANQKMANSAFTIGEWTHIVAVLTTSSSTTKFYVNGVLQSGSNATDYITADGNNIGAREHAGGAANSAYFRGSIDQIRIYDSAISAADVTTLYKEVECSPAAINALDQFNTVLYTGNGGTQAVTGVGFKPDFSWVKNRNRNQWTNAC